MPDRISATDARARTCDVNDSAEEVTTPLDDRQELDRTTEGFADPVLGTKVARPRAGADRNTFVSRAVRLSPEAIATIISFLDGLSARMAASQVCHRWRDVALSQPRLWSNVSVHELAEVNLGAGGPYGSNDRHCEFGYHNPARVVISSNLHHLPLLLGRSAKAPVELNLRAQAHRDSALEGSEFTPGDVRKRINDSTSSGTVYGKDRLAELFPGTVNPVVDVLMHVSGLADRLTSMSLRMSCSTWLFLFACLPPMLALKTLIISDDPNRSRSHIGELFYIPASFWQLLQTENTPALPVAFPALETLRVSGIPGRSAHVPAVPRLTISQRRIESLLCSLPSLKQLDISLRYWPTITPVVAKDAAERKQSGTGNRTERSGRPGLPNLSHVRLCANRSELALDSVAFGHVVDVLPLNTGCCLHYEAVDEFRSYDTLLSVFSINAFRPKTLKFTQYDEVNGRDYWKTSAELFAVDVEGSTRTAVGSVTSRYGVNYRKLYWTGTTLQRYLDTEILTSLTVDMVSWTQLAADLVAHALESLTLIVGYGTLEDAARGRSKPPTTSHLRPRTVTFAVDKSISEQLDRLRLGARPLWRRADFDGSDSDSESDRDEDYTPEHYKVHYLVFVHLLQAVHTLSDGAAKLDKLVIARELKAMPKRAGAEAFAKFSDQVVML